MSADWIDRMSAQYLISGAISSHSIYHSLNLRTLSTFLYSDFTPEPGYLRELKNVEGRFVEFYRCPRPILDRVAKIKESDRFNHWLKFVEETLDVPVSELQYLIDNVHVIYKG